MAVWSDRRILILGMTYPSYSRKYVETVCTGGLEAESLSMVRLHPIPHRYLEDGSRFSSFQWISARIARHSSDPRPDSFRVEPSSITIHDAIGPDESEARASLLLRSPNYVRSVEELLRQQRADGRSLGIMKPKEITRVIARERTQLEREQWHRAERLFSQVSLFERPKPIAFPEYEFLVSWICDDPSCGGHQSGIKQWGLHELSRKLAGDADRKSKLEHKMAKMLDLKYREVFFFLGSFRRRMYQFGLMDCYSAPRSRQMKLFPA